MWWTVVLIITETSSLELKRYLKCLTIDFLFLFLLDDPSTLATESDEEGRGPIKYRRLDPRV